MSRFQPGQSGNPKGKPKGARHKTTLAVERLLDADAKNLTKKAFELAKAGDLTALRLCLERICPPRKDRPVPFEMPKLEAPADALRAATAIVSAVALGELSPGEAGELAKVVES